MTLAKSCLSISGRLICIFSPGEHDDSLSEDALKRLLILLKLHSKVVGMDEVHPS